MPYRMNNDLPPGVRGHLPEHAQNIFREAFNHAWQNYAQEGERREEIAHRVAWAAVKKNYCKVGSDWIAKNGMH
jgi:cation transport regulator